MDYKVSDLNIPLVADLDGTFINTDLLYESLILLFKKNPLNMFYILYWVLKGKGFFKNMVFKKVVLNYQHLPYNDKVLRFINEEHAKGRKIILATASPISAAKSVAQNFSLFSEVYGTENEINFAGNEKTKKLIEHFGSKGFDYIGNSSEDLKVFSACRNAYLVNPSTQVERNAKKIPNLKDIWKTESATIKDYVKAVRIYQWIKNLLLFVPLITSHSFGSIKDISISFFAFCTFNLAASAGYLLNDLLDLNSDRMHPRKRYRSIAFGKITIPQAFSLAMFLLVIGLFFAAKLSLAFFIVLTVYFFTSFFYSIVLKKIELYDVFILALLYSVRVVAGAIAINVPLSFWLIAFSTFIFLSLAFVKRYSELMQSGDDENLINKGRGYLSIDLNLLGIMGIASGFISVVVFSLYINSTEVTQLYSKPKVLWTISFLFLFWISRMWLITTRGKMTDDPIVFAIKDITSYVIFFLTGILILVSI